jgi:leucyl aminopeptidase
LKFPVSAAGYQCDRLSFVSLGKLSNSDLRTSGAAIGRKLRGKDIEVFFSANLKSTQIKSLLISMNLGNFTWNLKTGAKTLTARVGISNIDVAILSSAQIVSDAVNRARTLIHTPSNIKNPEWTAKQAKNLANGVKVEVKSGAELKDFGGLRAVGGSVPKPGPRFIKMTYAPKKSGAKHIVLVGKGITYDTGGIGLDVHTKP